MMVTIVNFQHLEQDVITKGRKITYRVKKD